MTVETNNIAIIGGGAAGFFTALSAAEADPSAKVTIYESGRRTLTKVKISGGGRCNVTHNCYDPKQLIKNYPRGSRELLGAFHRWQPTDTLQWFAERGVKIKAEPDGRMFPVTNDSQTIIDCFEREAQNTGVQINKSLGLDSLAIGTNGRFDLELSDGSLRRADKVCIAVGSLKGSKIERIVTDLGHSIEPLAPSLFAFNLADKRTHGLSGLSAQNATVKTARKGSAQKGPVLITHRGLSGPAILRLSAWEARKLQEQNYHFDIWINWLGDVSENQLREQLNQLRKGKTQVKSKVFEEIPRRYWERLVEACGIAEDQKWAQLPKDKESALINELISAKFSVQGKTTNKDEFVTCGGVCRKEIDWRTMESKVVPGLHYAGECIDIDGITGGFNFQAAWTTAHIAGVTMATETNNS
ncbi:MAG: NAD(P)/FAD-dependent oxidoreductase [Opitutales bacterium]